MKFTLSWLKEYLDTSASAEEIAEKLTAIGHEVESVFDPAESLKGYTVAEVLSAEKHPDADRLKVCRVKSASGELPIVCGAANCEAGMKAILGTAGMYVPGRDFTLKISKIRGQESHGMLMAADELGLEEASEGIIRVADDVKVGTPAAEALGLNDPVIEIALTPNRADCAAVYGLARDLAAAGMGTLKPWQPAAVLAELKTAPQVNIEDAGCPAFAARRIENVKNGPSPAWLQQRLKAIGLRPISALVDITNYMTHAFGRPLHVYDADKLKGSLKVRATKGGESFAALNDKTYTVCENAIGIHDDSGLIGLGGIVGGVSTGVDETTKNVIVECAAFDPVRIAETGRKLQILSDARYRFERGVDPASIQPGMEEATKMILELCGGKASAVTLAGKIEPLNRTISFDMSRLKTLGGMEMKAGDAEKILANLGFALKGKNIHVPTWRADVEGEADLVEEVLRIVGYDRVPAVSLTPPVERPAVYGAVRQRLEQGKRFLASRGILETVTWSFVSEKQAALFGGGDAALTLLNPIAEELKVMRPSALIHLLAAAERNAARGYPDLALFESGPVFTAQGQQSVFAILRAGQAVPKTWSGPARAVDVFDAKADAQAVLEIIGAPASLQISREVPSYYHPGRSGALRLGKVVLAYFGEVHPLVAEAFGVDQPVAMAEIFVEKIPESRAKGKKPLSLSPFQPLARDFAFVVDHHVAAEALMRAAQGADKALIDRVEIFDVYEGEHVAAGKKSVALSVIIQPREATLTDAEIESLSKKIIDSIQSATGGQLRG